MIGRSVDAVSSMERGVTLPGYETLENLAQALQVPVGDLFGHGSAGQSETQVKLLAALVAQARDLTEAELAIALDQVLALVRHRQAR